MANIKEIAEAAGVSVTTASRALSGKGRVSQETIRRVSAAAERVDFRPSEIARGLYSGQTKTLGLVVPDITNPFFPELMAGAEETGKEFGRTVFLVAANSSDRAREDLGLLRARSVDGLVVVGNPFDSAVELSDYAVGTPLVVVDRTSSVAGISSVSSDHTAGTKLAAQHLVSLGHQHIAHLSGPSGLDVSDMRRNGYEAEMARHGFAQTIRESGFSVEGGSAAVQQLLADGSQFTGIVAANDLAAIGALRALSEAGLSVPDDVSVIGYDDIHLASLMWPPLTTVRQQISELGEAAVQEIERQIGGAHDPRSQLLDVELIVRSTTGSPA